MDEFFEKLAMYGFDKENVMKRFLDDEEFYYECFEEVLNDEAFENLGRFIEGGRMDEAFDCAHSLKGIISNVGLEALFEKVSDVVEILRGTKEGEAAEYYADCMKLRKEILMLLF